MFFDSENPFFWFLVAATLVIVLWSIAVYVIEARRTGAAPWSEWYNDRVVLLPRNKPRHPKHST
jgi:hypothetical protein